jgi:hypothetical protein
MNEQKYTIVGYEDNNRVTVDPSFQTDQPHLTVHPTLKPILDALLIEKPLWTFHLRHVSWEKVVTSIVVRQDGERLGDINRGWLGSTPVYEVKCDRITAERRGRKPYQTKNVKSALLAIKKNFYLITNEERIDHTKEKIENAMDTVVRTKRTAKRHIDDAIRNAGLTFLRNEGHEIFLEYLRTKDPTVFNTVAKSEELMMEIDHITAMEAARDSGKNYLVSRNNSGYIVSSPNGVFECDDAHLPEEIRLKLGMLKLVENEHFIVDMGFRLDENSFLILKDKE